MLNLTSRQDEMPTNSRKRPRHQLKNDHPAIKLIYHTKLSATECHCGEIIEGKHICGKYVVPITLHVVLCEEEICCKCNPLQENDNRIKTQTIYDDINFEESPNKRCKELTKQVTAAENVRIMKETVMKDGLTFHQFLEQMFIFPKRKMQQYWLMD